MIDEITISNVGVIADAHFHPGPGFTVLTGETGAGKTMVLTSLGLLMGRKADTSIIRHGEERLDVEGILSEPPNGPAHTIIEEAGGMADDDIIISRVVMAKGRSRAYAGGKTVPAGVLHAVGEHMVTIHGQADQLLLRTSSAQRELLDEAGGAKHSQRIRRYREAWEKWKAAQKAQQEWLLSAQQRREELERLRHGLEILEELSPAPHEDHDLQERIERLANVEDLRVAAQGAHDLLSGEDAGNDIIDALGQAERLLESGAHIDHQLGDYQRALKDASSALSDVSTSLASYLTDLEADPEQLDNAQRRLHDLTRASAPYGGNVDAFRQWADKASVRLNELDNPESHDEAYQEAVEKAHKELQEAGSALRDSRAHVAETLVTRVRHELRDLAMADAGFVIAVTEAEPSAQGMDTVEFLLSAPDGSTRPLAHGASGGELSRIMLALEVSVLDSRDTHTRPTLIFDEIDAGIGGATATSIGARLARLSRNFQIIVVTHLAQVAAFADTHLVVKKEGDTTRVEEVTGDTRIDEIARMLSGQTDSQAAQAHAAELLRAHQVQ